VSARISTLPDALTFDPDELDELEADCLDDLREFLISTDMEDDDE
jgi:hypothetical protein